MKPSNYKIVFEPEAQAWFDKQLEDVQMRVLLILNTFAASKPSVMGFQMQNGTRWFDSEWGWARKIYMDSAIRGLRCIYYVWEAKHEMIVVKFGTHADDVYEDSN
jgi:hypothetical protein